jgi:hypothetical protein
VYEIPKDWLRLSPERIAANHVIDSAIYKPTLERCLRHANLTSPTDFPKVLRKRLRAIVNATVRHAARPGFYADLNDPQVQDLVISESVRHLVWTFGKDEARVPDESLTPELNDEDFEKAFAEEKARIEKKEYEKKLREEENKLESLYCYGQSYASENVTDEIPEITADELGGTLPEEAIEGDPAFSSALEKREQRRKVIMSRLGEEDVPEWLKHAVDTEDKELFPIASGKFTRVKTREDLLAEFFQQKLDQAGVGSEGEAKLLEFMDKFIEEEESGLVREESLEEVRARVEELLSQIDGDKESIN